MDNEERPNCEYCTLSEECERMKPKIGHLLAFWYVFGCGIVFNIWGLWCIIKHVVMG
jgi:hypothetical protein